MLYHRFPIIFAVLGAIAGAAAKPGTKWMELSRRQHERQSAAREAKPPVVEKRETGTQFLNANTSKFLVDSSKLPDIDFDLGESYAGLLPINNTANSSELFFWFFPSTNPAAKKEIIIWFTGGPGCSSIGGLFQENGPVTWKPGTYAPVKNPYSYHLLSNVVWVDQPVGTGYSEGTPDAQNEFDVAAEFRGFWKHFVDTFGMHGYSVYVTGESYGGVYCPYIANGMLDQHDKTYFNVSGMMVYDGLFGDFTVAEQIVAVPFIDYWSGLFPFNDSFSAAVHQNHIKCGYQDYLDKYLVYPPCGQQPVNLPGITADQSAYLPGCDTFDDIITAVQWLNPCFNIYEVSAQCPIPYDPLGFSGATGYYPDNAPEIYFNRSEVKTALHVPTSKDWSFCVDGVFPNGDNSLPTSQVQLPGVIDRTQNVILVYGTFDMVLIANGTLLAIQNMTWGGKMGFQQRPSSPLFVPYHEDASLGTAAGAGVFGTTHTERGLTWNAVVLSGHEVPSYQPSVSYRQLEVLLGRIKNMESTAPFTTDTNHTAQPSGGLGSGIAAQMWASHPSPCRK